MRRVQSRSRHRACGDQARPDVSPSPTATRYDLIFDLFETVRVQCKWARCRRCRDRSVLLVPSNTDGLTKKAYGRRDRRLRRLLHRSRSLFLFSRDERRTNDSSTPSRPSRNNQGSGINWATTLHRGATIRGSGAVAQLGERLPGSQKVRGSSPLGSIGNPSSLARRASDSPDHASGGSNRYPIRASVWNERGRDGSGSSLRRIWAM